MKKLPLFLIAWLLCASTPPPKVVSVEESLFLKRIHEFWKDRDYPFIQQQILEFLTLHPASAIHDNLQALLGDLYFQENKNTEALLCYSKLTDPQLKRKTLYSHVRCLYEKGDFESLIALALPFFQEEKKSGIEYREDVQFLLAESLFRKFLDAQDIQLKAALAHDTKKLYQTFSVAEYKELSLLPLAYLHRHLLEYPEAASLYLLLAEKDVSKKEEFLLQAAHLQATFDKKSASETYLKIVTLKGPHAAESAYNGLLLLFQEKAYPSLLSHTELLKGALSSEHLSLFDFCVGFSHFQEKQFNEAALFLEKYNEEEKSLSTRKKTALTLLILCAQQLKNEMLYEKSVKELFSAFPQEEESAQSLLAYADYCIAHQEISKAVQNLELLVEHFPNFAERAAAFYNYALLLSQEGKLEESKTAFRKFLKEFPQHPLSASAWKELLHCSLKDLSKEGVLAPFVEDLQAALHQEPFFAPDQKQNYTYLLAKALFDLKQYEACSLVSQNSLAGHPGGVWEPKHHLLLALCQYEQHGESERFVFHAQKALEQEVSSDQKRALQRALFNAYIKRGQYDQAAEALFDYTTHENTPVHLENHLWLANYYFQESKKNPHHPLAGERACFLFEKLLTKESAELHIEKEKPFLEIEALKWSELLSADKKVSLLSQLISLQEKEPEAGWKTQRQALFELGKAYAALQKTDEALSLFDRLVESATLTPSYFSQAALLEKNRLLYALCPLEERTETNGKIIRILSALKDLQGQKKVYFEPLHLEAALQYADIRTQLSSTEKKNETALFFLKRIKQDFAEDEEYLSLRKEFPEKEPMFQNYLSCIQGEILRLEGNKPEATTLLKQVVEDLQATPFIRARAQTNLEALN